MCAGGEISDQVVHCQYDAIGPFYNANMLLVFSQSRVFYWLDTFVLWLDVKLILSRISPTLKNESSRDKGGSSSNP